MTSREEDAEKRRNRERQFTQTIKAKVKAK